MIASDLFVKCLEKEGVDIVFGVPGEENTDLLMSLYNSSIRFITCRHEQGAAFMADIYGRLTGRPGVCLSTLGPGATNLITGIASANLDKSPLIAITGQTSTNRMHKESHQAIDLIALFKPITKWCATIHEPSEIPEIIKKAVRLSRSEKPGAVHIELPENVAKMKADTEPLRSKALFRRPAPDMKSVKEAVRLIKQSDLPIILAGNGCVRTRVTEQLRRFISKTGIYVVNTFMAKGVLPDDNPRCLGTAGLSFEDHVTKIFREADLVICIGYDMVEWHPERWNIGKEKRIIHIDFEPAETDEHYDTDVEIVADIANTLAEMIRYFKPDHRREFPLCEKERSHIIREVVSMDDNQAFPMKPQRILSELSKILSDDGILICDVGAHKIWTARNYRTKKPGTCIISNGFASMGIAVPGAISAKLICPDKKVVALCGDGGFLMNVQELATAVQYNIPAVFLVWVDGSYGLIKWKQLSAYNRSVYNDFKNPDFSRLAESFGCKGLKVESAEEFEPTIREALNSDTPVVVEVKVDYSENLKLSSMNLME